MIYEVLLLDRSTNYGLYVEHAIFGESEDIPAHLLLEEVEDRLNSIDTDRIDLYVNVDGSDIPHDQEVLMIASVVGYCAKNNIPLRLGFYNCLSAGYEFHKVVV